MPHTLDVKRLQEVYDSIDDIFERLDKWEKRFIMTTRDQWERTGTLSEGQLEHLEKIYLKVP